MLYYIYIHAPVKPLDNQPTEKLLVRIVFVIQALVRSLGIVLGVNLIVFTATPLFLAILSPQKIQKMINQSTTA
ncbi:hypothetical protein A2973_04475 [Candidatus Gottesmanbacteria bacterium RIFCSPLOWO2_01_FULL_49_10]|uniref:Uncharacterized protein n=1 Tax=Candidatus Gottesmanbacteria bacterium RIFCSPLOWO2_01_FULL_49_10 TaxID=1798396 RepID=A0A1F6AVY9_9BACT|nr:MAG: hypothetical protein UY10_C0009G0003 [Microgenomates group bacterium GW2011_GWA2_47_8]OGG28849.1 MAG: hypothetical protein A2973_04475 [Candidatus Gottesmanbacteria bacterium RIFCSPLOWO2_01_FULL_49_10]